MTRLLSLPLLLGILATATVTTACSDGSLGVERPAAGQPLSADDATTVCASLTEQSVCPTDGPISPDAAAVCESLAETIRGDYLIDLEACQERRLAENEQASCSYADSTVCRDEILAAFVPTATGERYLAALEASRERCDGRVQPIIAMIHTDELLEQLLPCLDEPTCQDMAACETAVYEAR